MPVTVETGIDVVSLGIAIRARREGKNLSVHALGELIDRSGSAVSQYELGQREMGVELLGVIAHALGTSPERIIKDAKSLG